MLVLLIEDNQLLRKNIRRWLQRAGIAEIGEADNGQVGLELQRRDPAKLVITDIYMPKKEGLETILTLRREFPEVKIIAISGGGRFGMTETSLSTASRLGAERVLEKPFDAEELLAAVRELLSD